MQVQRTKLNENFHASLVKSRFRWAVCCAILENGLVIFMRKTGRINTSRNRVRFKLDSV